MDSEAVKVAKIQAEVAALRVLVFNPVIEIVGAMVLCELLQRHPRERPIFSQKQGDLVELGIVGVIGIQQLAPSLPYLAEAGSQIFAAAGKAALVAGAGA